MGRRRTSFLYQYNFHDFYEFSKTLRKNELNSMTFPGLEKENGIPWLFQVFHDWIHLVILIYYPNCLCDHPSSDNVIPWPTTTHPSLHAIHCNIFIFPCQPGHICSPQQAPCDHVTNRYPDSLSYEQRTFQGHPGLSWTYSASCEHYLKQQYQRFMHLFFL